MSEIQLRADEPGELLEVLKGAGGTRASLGIPVLVSAQDSRDVAESIRNAVFICESVVRAFERPLVGIEKNASDPNSEVVYLRGTVTRPEVLRDFVQEWYGTLDPDDVQESFAMASDEAECLFRRLESDEPESAFKFPELVNWYRTVREQFDEWDAESEE